MATATKVVPVAIFEWNTSRPAWQRRLSIITMNSWEELFILEGDCFIADEGVLAPGSAVGHPQEFWHGPFASRRGCLFLVHTDAPMGVPWGIRDYPNQQEICDAYFSEAPWDGPIEFGLWADLPWKRFSELPEFIEWEKTLAGQEWGDKVGQLTASKFRASWKRSVEKSLAKK